MLVATPVAVQSSGVSFLAVGDWGGGSDKHPTTAGQRAAAAGMSKMADKLGVQGVLLLGDNFYEDGVASCSSQRFEETFEEVYTADAFNDLPFYVIAGNHDHNGNVNAQVEYKDQSGRWHFPSLWYRMNFTFNSSSGVLRTLDLLMIDTVNLAGDSSDNCDNCTRLGPLNSLDAELQWEWIESQLRSSTADFLWVAGHYPIFSAGNDGTNDILVKRLLPMLKQHGAHYVDGHDHMLEHISYDGVEMFVTGMGRECCYGTKNIATVPSGAIQFMISGDGGQGTAVGPKPSGPVQGGFASIEFDDVVNVVYYNQDGDVLYGAPAVKPRSKGLLAKMRAVSSVDQAESRDSLSLVV
eukprot:TRINITY_DN12701_c3_g1_i1.p1 TRINITY_DN12701_c3_g1~~TRINITY_DN12701_c3_g1_i1.p1  ORF type:complete len:387 (-),score=61.17 TRINITY_DN12701_c3_g1_i1:55-1113(-)